MKVLVFGSRDWKDYGSIMRNMTVFLEDIKYDGTITNVTFVHTGGRGAENMLTEYVGKVEKFLRQKGISIREEIIKFPYGSSKSVNHYNMIEDGADYALVFQSKDDRKLNSDIKLLEEFNIPTRITVEQ
jgi:hypothetical protein